MNYRVILCAATLLLAAFAPRAAGYTLYGSKWVSSVVTMQLQLGAGSGVLLDGFPSWGASAEDALTTWNGYLAATKFSSVRDSTATTAQRNRLNNVFFSGDVYGQAWGSGVIAVTLIFSTNTIQTETDVLFNNRLTWNSYRGPLRYAGNGTAILDFHRVALHEFGHALGLDHPDEAGQNVTAVMNSRISAVDAPTADDISGAQSLYGSTAPIVTAPSITTQPSSRSVVAGQSTTFSVVAAGTAPLAYQWSKSGLVLAGASGTTFTLSNVTQNDAGSYTATVSNSAGSVTSAVATLIVTEPSTPTTPTTPTAPPPPAPPPPSPPVTPPSIAVGPASQSANANTNVSLYVVATGSSPLQYQWRKEGAVIAGAIGSVFSLPNVQPAQAGAYSVTVSNSAGSVTSSAAVLAILSPPVIVTQPADQTVPIGGRLRISVVASGTPPLSYVWRKDGSAITAATDSSYEVVQATSAHSGNYSVIVSGSGGSTTSATARIAVVAVAPALASALAEQTASAGDAVSFSVSPNGTPPFAYQWFKDAIALPGATSATFSLSSVHAADGGSYSVRISNDAGSITSGAAALTVKSSRLVNLSTRAFVPAGGTLTPGFFIRGDGSKPLLIRAVGPTLRLFGIEGALADARLELVAQGSVSVVRDQDYQAVTDNDAAAGVGAFPLSPGAKDAAVQASLSARGYTVRVSAGEPGMAGITLAEIYDASSPTARAELVNLSTLGFVGSGENVLTAGFVISGNAPKRLLVRAVGPGLAPFGLSGLLADPQLAVLRQGVTEPLATNDNWPDLPSVRNAFSAAGAFNLTANSSDAALLVTLEPGAYTVLVSSVTAAVTGVALVEIYDLDP